jgi:hypothetical protein
MMGYHPTCPEYQLKNPAILLKDTHTKGAFDNIGQLGLKAGMGGLPPGCADGLTSPEMGLQRPPSTRLKGGSIPLIG